MTVFVLGSLALPASAYAATDFMWSGGAPSGTSNWSNTVNWVGGSAPGGSVGTLSFPQLTGSGCTASPPTDTCYTSHNDITGLSANAISIDDARQTGGSYAVSGAGITLGSGGIIAVTTPSGTGAVQVPISFPIALGASQTWSIDGG